MDSFCQIRYLSFEIDEKFIDCINGSRTMTKIKEYSDKVGSCTFIEKEALCFIPPCARKEEWKLKTNSLVISMKIKICSILMLHMLTHRDLKAKYQNFPAKAGGFFKPCFSE